MKASLFANVDGITDGRSNVSAMLNVFGNEFTYDQTALTNIYKTADANAGTESPYVKAAKLLRLAAIITLSLFMYQLMVLS